MFSTLIFVQSANDPCIYTASEGVYVDDIVIAGESSERITEVKKALSEKFDVKDLGELNYFLGVQVVQDHTDGKVWIVPLRNQFSGSMVWKRPNQLRLQSMLIRSW